MKAILFVFVLIFSSIVFADIGPSPDPPEITVMFIEQDAPYLGSMELRYRCNIPPDADNGPMGDREVDFSCNNGVCKNAGWFYKLNPCFDNNQGYLAYKKPGETEYQKTDILAFSGNDDMIEINLDSNEVTLIPGEDKEPACCLSMGIIAFIGCGLFLTRKNK